MAASTNEDVYEHCLRHLGVEFTLKEEQVQCLDAVLKGSDVLAVLPTGYGKSMIYQIAPYAISVRRGHLCQNLKDYDRSTEQKESSPQFPVMLHKISYRSVTTDSSAIYIVFCYTIWKLRLIEQEVWLHLRKTLSHVTDIPLTVQTSPCS